MLCSQEAGTSVALFQVKCRGVVFVAKHSHVYNVGKACFNVAVCYIASYFQAQVSNSAKWVHISRLSVILRWEGLFPKFIMSSGALLNH